MHLQKAKNSSHYQPKLVPEVVDGLLPKAMENSGQ